MSEAMEILLVEDDPADVELTLHALKTENVSNRIVVARDGEDALEILLGQGARTEPQAYMPRLILLDLKLPKVDGLEVLRQIKSNDRTRTIPVVILTSSREERDRLQGYVLGVNSYIQKPVDFDQFRQVVKQLGLYWLVVNQPAPLTVARASTTD
jgi:two-component system response regulator